MREKLTVNIEEIERENKQRKMEEKVTIKVI